MPELPQEVIDKMLKDVSVKPRDEETRRVFIKWIALILIFYFWVGPFLLTWADTWNKWITKNLNEPAATTE